MVNFVAGRCTNFGLCSKADSHATQTAEPGIGFVCQECQRRLTRLQALAKPRSRSNPVWMTTLVVIACMIGWWYSRRQPSQTGTEAPTANASIILRLSEPDTIGMQVAPDLVQAWLTARGASEVRAQPNGTEKTTVAGLLNGSPVAVEVQSLESATVFQNLGAGSCDIAMAWGQIKPEEAAGLAAKGLGDFLSDAQQRVLGLDGIAIVVNNQNSTAALDLSQISDIFSGTGATLGWHVYAPDDQSDTYARFKQRVLRTRTLISSAKRFENSSQLVMAVEADPRGIGFVSLPYAIGVRILAISGSGASPLLPTRQTIRSGAYPLSGRLYLYVPQNAGSEALDFVRFALSSAGQETVGKDGFITQQIQSTTAEPSRD